MGASSWRPKRLREVPVLVAAVFESSVRPFCCRKWPSIKTHIMRSNRSQPIDADQVTLPQFTTIGHSNRSMEEFSDMLRAAQVALLVDVRTFPRSRAKDPAQDDRHGTAEFYGALTMVTNAVFPLLRSGLRRSGPSKMPLWKTLSRAATIRHYCCTKCAMRP